MTFKLIFLLLVVIGGLVTFALAEVSYKLSKKVATNEEKKVLEREALFKYATSATCFYTALLALIFLMIEGAKI